jgi:hypothetical protein
LRLAASNEEEEKDPSSGPTPVPALVLVLILVDSPLLRASRKNPAIMALRSLSTFLFLEKIGTGEDDADDDDDDDGACLPVLFARWMASRLAEGIILVGTFIPSRSSNATSDAGNVGSALSAQVSTHNRLDPLLSTAFALLSIC